MRKSKLFPALAVAFAMCLSCFAFTAFADDPPAKGKPGNPNAPAETAIAKVLQMPKGTNTPAGSFTFKLEPISVDGNDQILPPAIADKTTTFTASLPSAESGTGAASVKTVVVETSDIFAGVDWPHTGIFVYELTENQSTSITLDAKHDALTYSQAKYTLNVYVKEGAKADGTKVFYVFAIGATVTTPDNLGQTSGEKVDPTPGGDPNVSDDYSGIVFTNKYVRTNGPTDPDNPGPIDPDNPDGPGGPSAVNAALLVSKTVDGEFKDESIYFNYELTARKPSLAAAKTYKAYIIEGSTVIDPASNKVASSLIGTDAAGKYIKFEDGVKVAFSLKHGQKLVFTNTPVGTNYDVSEAGTVAYQAQLTITYNGTGGTPIQGATLGAGVAASDKFVGHAANKADFLNTRDSVTPTGLNLNDLPFIGMIALALVAVAAFVVVKARRKKLCD